MTCRSGSDSSTLLRSGPAMTRSMASSSAAMEICLPLVRAVSSAPSLMTLARSAPVKPGVRRAMMSRSVSGAMGLPRACTLRMPRRPARSGWATTIWRSNRPGRSSAGSRMSGRVVAAITLTPALGVESVQLDQHLVQRLLALVVPAAEARAAVPAHGVDLVHEHDGGGVRLGLLEQVPDPGGADTDEH